MLCRQWGAAPLEDNLPTDTYHYQVTVNTGLKKNSGTQSRIQFILSGDEGDTGVRRLFDGKRRVGVHAFSMCGAKYVTVMPSLLMVPNMLLPCLLY